ncbi:MAG: transcriptional repressor LexA [Anaerolineales bacterium]|nr:transcriptional repressor LexA [Anaerolineales bacterium]MDW8161226.1 transcriptional repressor LexA [Anaerolineales bacterium]
MMARRKIQQMQDRHRRIVAVLHEFLSDLGYPPSIREICERTGITSTSMVNRYLEQLEEWGVIERDGGVSRGIRLLRSPAELGIDIWVTVPQRAQSFAEELLHIPIVGRIQAGQPLPVPGSDFASFDPEHAIAVASSLFSKRDQAEDLFALEVRGDSMVDAMINDGDIVIMRPVTEVRNGEMVAVWLKDVEETTLKYFYKENGRVRLQPANPAYQPIIIEHPESVEVQGKVVMVIRKFSGEVTPAA